DPAKQMFRTIIHIMCLFFSFSSHVFYHNTLFPRKQKKLPRETFKIFLTVLSKGSLSYFINLLYRIYSVFCIRFLRIYLRLLCFSVFEEVCRNLWEKSISQYIFFLLRPLCHLSS